MIDAIIKGAIAIGAGVAAWYADKYVKEKTGKHIHEHAVDYVKSLWDRLKNWAQQYLSEHLNILKVYVCAVEILARMKRAYDCGEKIVKVQIFGKTYDNRTKLITEEEVPIDQVKDVIKQAETNPVLAMRC